MTDWYSRAEELRIIAGLMRDREPAMRLMQLADACDGLGERKEQREKTRIQPKDKA